jgi:hypothetical protein
MNNFINFYRSNITWLGDLATWVSGIGIVSTFAIGFLQINNERKIRKEKEKKEQAVHISAFILKETPSKTTISLLNLSNEPIYEVIVSISAFQSAGASPTKQVSRQFTSFLSVVPPGKSFTHVDGSYHEMAFHPSIEIAFKDVKGKSWLRTGRGVLKEIAKSPVEYYKLLRPLTWRLPVYEN